jgi:hypothetical protein
MLERLITLVPPGDFSIGWLVVLRFRERLDDFAIQSRNVGGLATRHQYRNSQSAQIVRHDGDS